LSFHEHGSQERAVTVDRDLCVGSTLCTQIAPQIFALDPEGRSSVIGDPCNTPELAQDAEDNCPVGAIRFSGVGSA
jgi:ferredoxin